MTADFSRVRFDALAAFTAVELQQGRVLLDADFNEAQAIADRRIRALASDVLGRATVSQTTPSAFRLTPVAGSFTIGLGRFYVDGLLAENPGIADPAAPEGGRRFDTLLAETAFATEPRYEQQPWLPAPPPLPTSGRHLVYLDVWERERTHVERPALVEPAVGVDTTVRRQLVWQVRVLGEEAGAGVDCASPDAEVPGWAALVAPPAGRLTTGTYDVAGSPDPCELPPTGGYTGLENQLYRVEIHDGGQPGAGATFKWSRDNASVATRVALVVSATELELDSIGRDEVLRVSVGDWVELTDDHRELAQRSGTLARIAEVDDATRRVRLAAALPADLLPAALPDSAQAAARNLRLRRWDQRGRILRTTGGGGGGGVAEVQNLDAPGSTGAIAVPAAGVTLLLENGVTVRFSTVGGGGLRAGDWWVFAARTATADVEPLEAAPPRGTHHHRTRLGFWDIGAGTIGDCRGDWPPLAAADDCSCTACVDAESHASGRLTLQDAIDRVREAGGGTVCIGIGQYALRAPLVVRDARSLRIRGQGPGTVLVGAGTLLQLRDGAALAVQDLSMLSLGQASAITAAGVLGLALERLAVVVTGNADATGACIALAGALAGVRIAGNLLVGREGIRSFEPREQALPRSALLAALAIEDNVLWCSRHGVRLDGPVVHLFETRIAGNTLMGAREAGLTLLGAAPAAAALRVERNQVQGAGRGIVAGSGVLWVEGNALRGPGRERAGAGRAGLELATGIDADGLDAAHLVGNDIQGHALAMRLAAPVRQLLVKLNTIAACGDGIQVAGLGAQAQLAIENNQLRDIGPAREAAEGAVTAGIALLGAARAVVAGNALDGIGADAPTALLRSGVLALGAARLRLAGNTLAGIGPAGDFAGRAIGLFVAGRYGQLDVQGNHVERAGGPDDDGNGRGRVGWAAVVAGAPLGAGGGAVAPPTTTVNQPAVGLRAGRLASVPLDDGGELLLDGPQALLVAAAPLAGGSAALAGNRLAGQGSLPLVAVRAQQDCLFSDNHCTHRAVGGVPAVLLQAEVAIVTANRVRNADDVAIRADDIKTITALGNITTGILQMPGLAAAFAPLNLRG